MVALVDDEDAARVASFRWQARLQGNIWYAVRTVDGGRHTKQAMHRLLLCAPRGSQVDHVNGNGLDNRRSNLRYCTNGQNQQNRHHARNNTSGFRGVTWNKASQKWQAGIKYEGKSIHLGLHDNREDAARAYDIMARQIFGSFAHPNFPEGEA
jgi:hypothetical protein